MSKKSVNIFNKILDKSTQDHQYVTANVFQYLKDCQTLAPSKFKNFDLLKKRTIYCKTKAMNNLEDCFKSFEFLFTKRGGKIIWAVDAESATNDILEILKAKKTETVVKSRSNIFSEIDLYNKLSNAGINIEQSDINSLYSCAEQKEILFSNKSILNSSIDNVSLSLQSKYKINSSDISDTVDQIKKKNIENVLKSNVSIIEADFLLSDIGGIVVCDTEGNTNILSSNSKTLIILAGIDQMLPSIVDLDKILYLKSASISNNILQSTTKILSGPRKDGESDGPEELYLVLIDNHRTGVMKSEKHRIVFNCIGCTICANSCPVYRNLGQQVYKSSFVGPLGSAMNPLLMNFPEYIWQSYACTMCGRCSEFCPMDIPLHKLILYNRKDSIDSNDNNFINQRMIKLLSKMKLSRKESNSKWNRYKLRRIINKKIGLTREPPVLRSDSFSIQYLKEKQEISQQN